MLTSWSILIQFQQLVLPDRAFFYSNIPTIVIVGPWCYENVFLILHLGNSELWIIVNATSVLTTFLCSWSPYNKERKQIFPWREKKFPIQPSFCTTFLVLLRNVFFRVQGWPLALHYQDQKRLSIFTVTEVLLLNVSKLTVMFKHLCLLCVMYCHLESNLILFLIGSGNKWILNTHFGKWFISVLHQK